jgi:hypothetical protein
MSGTLGVSPLRAFGVAGVLRVGRSARERVAVLRRRGGLPVVLAVPVAIAVTTSVVWVTVALASSWVSA